MISVVCVHKFVTNKTSVMVHIAQIGNEKTIVLKICKSLLGGV